MRVSRVLLMLSWVLLSCGLHLKRHQYTMDTSKEIANSIKQYLLQRIDQFSNKQFRQQLKQDLEESDDSLRVLKSIDVISADELFDLLTIENPNCDANGDYEITGTQLKCLNIIWKVFVPH